MSNKLKSINGVKPINDFKDRKIGCEDREVLVLAESENSKWEAQLALEVYSYGQVFIVWKTNCKDKHELPKPLGTSPIKEKESLMNLSRLRRGLLAAYFRYIAQNNKFLYYSINRCGFTGYVRGSEGNIL